MERNTVTLPVLCRLYAKEFDPAHQGLKPAYRLRPCRQSSQLIPCAMLPLTASSPTKAMLKVLLQHLRYEIVLSRTVDVPAEALMSVTILSVLHLQR